MEITKQDVKPLPKDDLIVICLSREDKSLIQENAIKNRLTLSSYCLNKILGDTKN